jgi:hypothetical protein
MLCAHAPGLPSARGQSTSAAGRAAVDPEADRLLRSMSDYLGRQNEFTVEADGTTGTILQSGQKVQVTTHSKAYVRRPNRLTADRTGDSGGDIQIFYDGSNFTLYSKRQNAYTSLPAGKTLDATLTKVQQSGEVELPAADLLYGNVYAGLMPDVISGEYLGGSIIDGVPTHHLAFRSRDVDWEIWIEDGPRPLPKKYVITSKKMKDSPSYDVVFSNWNLAPRLSDDVFKFRPPPGAEKVKSIMQPQGAAAGKPGPEKPR